MGSWASKSSKLRGFLDGLDMGDRVDVVSGVVTLRRLVEPIDQTTPLARLGARRATTLGPNEVEDPPWAREHRQGGERQIHVWAVRHNCLERVQIWWL
jgi:hypothetical protein